MTIKSSEPTYTNLSGITINGALPPSLSEIYYYKNTDGYTWNGHNGGTMNGSYTVFFKFDSSISSVRGDNATGEYRDSSTCGLVTSKQTSDGYVGYYGTVLSMKLSNSDGKCVNAYVTVAGQSFNISVESAGSGTLKTIHFH